MSFFGRRERTHLDQPKTPSIAPKSSFVVHASGRDVCSLDLLGNTCCVALKEEVERLVFEQDRNLDDLHIGTHAGSNRLDERQKKTSYLSGCLAWSFNVRGVADNTYATHTTILRPSATSVRSLAALTRFRVLNARSRRSKSSIAVNHDSPTSVSKMMVARDGGMHRSDKRLDKGLSIFCKRTHMMFCLTCTIMNHSPAAP